MINPATDKKTIILCQGDTCIGFLWIGDINRLECEKCGNVYRLVEEA